MVVVATGRKILIWRTFVFQTGSSYISRKLRYVGEIRFEDTLVDLELRKSATTLNIKPEILLRQRGCHLEMAYYIITVPRMARLERNLVI